jgi:hypothetical protein
MRWNARGGQAIVTMRGWDQSDRFDEAWALVAATYHSELHVLANVIDLTPKPTRNARGGASRRGLHPEIFVDGCHRVTGRVCSGPLGVPLSQSRCRASAAASTWHAVTPGTSTDDGDAATISQQPATAGTSIVTMSVEYVTPLRKWRVTWQEFDKAYAP